MSFPVPSTISSNFNPLFFTNLSSSLTITNGDLRYLKITGGIISGSLNVNGSISINSIPMDLSLISGFVNGTPTNSKALTLDSSGNINGSLTLTGSISVANCNTTGFLKITRSSSGQTFSSINGTSTLALYHFNNSDCFFGTTSANSLILQTGNTARMIIDGSNGNITGISSLSATTLAGTISTAAQPNITSLGTLSNNLILASGIKIGFNNTPAFPIDFGAVANDRLLAVFNSTSSFYGFGANSSRLMLHSANSAGFRFFTNSTSTATGTQILDLDSTGLLAVSSMSLNSTLITATGAEINTVSGVTPGTVLASRHMVVDSNSTITFAKGSSTTSYLRLGGSLSSATKLYYDTTSGYTIADTGDNASGRLRVYNTYYNYSGTMFEVLSAGTQNIKLCIDANQSSNLLAVGTYGGSLNIATNSGSSSSSSNCLYFSGNSGSIGLGTQTPSGSVALDIVGRVHASSSLHIGTDIDTTRMISCLDSTMVSGDTRYITLGKAQAVNSQAEFSFVYGTTTSYMGFGFYAVPAILTYDASGNVGIGTTPVGTAKLTINGAGSSNSTIDAGGAGVAIANKTNYTSTAGPISTISLSLKTTHSVLIGGSVYVTSDRRKKVDIVDMDDEYADRFIKSVKPVFYKMKNQTTKSVGYIAQEILRAQTNEIINTIENSDMVIEGGPDSFDIEGFELSVSYDKIVVILHKALLSALNKIEIMSSYPPMAKFLAKN